jgi:hypothetical protein
MKKPATVLAVRVFCILTVKIAWDNPLLPDLRFHCTAFSDKSNLYRTVKTTPCQPAA